MEDFFWQYSPEMPRRHIAHLLLIPLVSLFALLSGCAPSISSDSYDATKLGAAQSVRTGTIESVRQVNVNYDSGLGALGGAVAGGAGGSAIGHGAGSWAAGAGGAVAGAVIGDQIDKAVNEQTGLEYIVKLDDGSQVSVVQGKQPSLAIGERVNVIMGENGGNRARIVAAN